MTNDERIEICKAFAYAVPIETISENMGMSKEDLQEFFENNKNEITSMSSYRTKLIQNRGDE